MYAAGMSDYFGIYISDLFKFNRPLECVRGNELTFNIFYFVRFIVEYSIRVR